MALRTSGLTLVELIVAMAVAAVLVTAALPSMHQLLATSALDAATRRLFAHIQLARTSAVQMRSIATLCPLDARAGSGTRAETRCGDDWRNGYGVFIDRDGDTVLDEGDSVVAIEDAPKGVQVGWRAFRRRNALQFRPDGATHLSNGTFTLCAATHPPVARRLVVNVGGRVRTERHEHAESICD